MRGILSLALAGLSTIQQRPPPLVSHPLTSTISIGLPADWVKTDAATRRKALTFADSVSRTSNDVLIREARRMGTPASLLVAESRNGVLLANVNLSPAPGTTNSDFLFLAKAELVPLGESVCATLRAGMLAVASSLPSCGSPRIELLPDRGALILEYTRQTRAQVFRGWAIFYPSKDAVVALMLEAPTAQASKQADLFQRIWQSVVIH